LRARHSREPAGSPAVLAGTAHRLASGQLPLLMVLVDPILLTFGSPSL